MIWKHSKCPSTDEWIKKMLYTHIYTHTGILVNKKNEIMPFAATWIDSEVIIPSEVSQIKTNMISFICGI